MRERLPAVAPRVAPRRCPLACKTLAAFRVRSPAMRRGARALPTPWRDFARLCLLGIVRPAFGHWHHRGSGQRQHRGGQAAHVAHSLHPTERANPGRYVPARCHPVGRTCTRSGVHGSTCRPRSAPCEAYTPRLRPGLGVLSSPSAARPANRQGCRRVPNHAATLGKP